MTPIIRSSCTTKCTESVDSECYTSRRSTCLTLIGGNCRQNEWDEDTHTHTHTHTHTRMCVSTDCSRVNCCCLRAACVDCFELTKQDLIAKDGLYLIRVATDDSSTHHVLAAIPAVRKTLKVDGHLKSAGQIPALYLNNLFWHVCLLRQR